MRSTRLDLLYNATSIAPPDIRRDIASQAERTRQLTDGRHPLHNQFGARSRLKSRRSFLHAVDPISRDPAILRREKWGTRWNESEWPDSNYRKSFFNLPKESIPSKLARLPRTTWRSFNRMRCLAGRCNETTNKWGFSENSLCDCGAIQSMKHLMNCPRTELDAMPLDFKNASTTAIQLATHWQSHI